MDTNTLELTLRNEELTSYLQEMLLDGCELNLSILNTINNYHKGRTSKNILFADLEAEWKFQKESNYAATRD